MLHWEADGRRTEESRKKIAEAWEDFLADVNARNLSSGTVRKYELLRRQLEAFAQGRGFRFLNELDLHAVTQFRNGWEDGPRSSTKKLERLRSFLRFAQKRKWIEENPATDLKSPKIQLRQTMPFTRVEMERLLKACRQYAKESPGRAKDNGLRIQALILLLRYSGMRIGDAVSLSTDRLKRDRLFLYTAKSGTPVSAVLPDLVVRAIGRMPKTSNTHFFWSGNGKVDSVASHWRKRLQHLFELAKVPDAHAHRFRDTFATELLLAGIPIERVSLLLGHQSVRITEKHYSPWVHARQAQLESDLKTAWKQDPFLKSTIRT
jgi:site-specific recombinase XerD